MEVSASSWLHCPIGVLSPICFTQSSSVMYSSFLSGNCSVESILDRHVKNSVFISAFIANVSQSLGIFGEPDVRHRRLCPHLSLVFSLMDTGFLRSQTISNLLDKPNWEKKHFFKIFSKVFPLLISESEYE